MKKYFGEPMHVGVYMLGEFIEIAGKKGDIQESVSLLQKNPIKSLPKLIQAGVNSYNEIEGNDKRINLLEACKIFEKHGMSSPDVSNLLNDFIKSLKVDLDEGKQKPKVKKPKK